jgi:hypothetical protein
VGFAVDVAADDLVETIVVKVLDRILVGAAMTGDSE